MMISPAKYRSANAARCKIELSWFGPTDLGLWIICQTGQMNSEPQALGLTDTHNAHTDNVLYTAVITTSDPWKVGEGR